MYSCSHLLLQVSGHLNWRTPSKRSSEYVYKILLELCSKVHRNKPVQCVERVNTDGKLSFLVKSFDGSSEVFDNVVFACHPDQALQILGSSATDEEREALSKFHYSVNDTYVHSDTKLMPKSKAAWTSWNYLGKSSQSDDKCPVFVTYWLNRLQHLNHNRDIFVSLNPTVVPDADKTFTRLQYSHPQYTKDSVKAQRLVAKLQGVNGAYFCGYVIDRILSILVSKLTYSLLTQCLDGIWIS